jgi:hypothetical protein
MYKNDLIGKKFGRWLVIGKAEKRTPSGTVYWHCKCDCGNEKDVITTSLKRGTSTSCGCYNRERTLETHTKNIAGERFGRLTVVCRDEFQKGKWKCACSCGKETIVHLSALRTGSTVSCGCYNKEATSRRMSKDIIGERFGRFLVLAKTENNKWGQSVWICQCDCGKIKNVSGTALRTGKVVSCGCYGREKLVERSIKKDSAFKDLFRNYKSRATTLKKEFNFTEDSFREITSLPCVYCGELPLQCVKTKGSQYVYNGIDRVDNTLGYTLDNCVPCCKTCNLAKRSMSVQEFIDWLLRAGNFQLKRTKNDLLTE